MCVWNNPVHCSHSGHGQKERNKGDIRSSPCHDDKEIQSVPRVPEVTASAKDSQGDHLYNHLQSEEDVDECIKSLTERHKKTEQGTSMKKEEDINVPRMTPTGNKQEKKYHCLRSFD